MNSSTPTTAHHVAAQPINAYTIPGAWLFVSISLVGAALFTFSTAALIMLIVEREDGGFHPIESLIELTVSVALLYLCASLANTFTGYSFLIFDEGFTQRRRQAAGEIVAWSKVAALRPRPILQRMDLRAANGRLLGTLEYQVRNLEHAFVDVVARVALPQTELPLSVRGRWSFTRTLLTALIATVGVGGFAVARAGRPEFLGFSVLAIGAGSYQWWSYRHTALRLVTIYHHGLVLHRGREQINIPWDDVLSIDFESRTGNNNTYMSATVATRNGEAYGIVPLGRESDVVRVYVAARKAYGQAAAARHA